MQIHPGYPIILRICRKPEALSPARVHNPSRTITKIHFYLHCCCQGRMLSMLECMPFLSEVLCDEMKTMVNGWPTSLLPHTEEYVRIFRSCVWLSLPQTLIRAWAVSKLSLPSNKRGLYFQKLRSFSYSLIYYIILFIFIYDITL